MERVIKIKCGECKEEHEIKVQSKDYEDWQNGKLIQRAMPYLTAPQRELLISQTCEPCFNKFFGGDE